MFTEVMDPEFPRRGANLKKGDANFFGGKFYGKLHENERNWIGSTTAWD